MSIEIRYHVRIDIDDERTKNSDDIDEKLGDLFFCKEINDINVFSGNACCDPYIEFWCETLDLANQYSNAFVVRLKKHKIYTTEV